MARSKKSLEQHWLQGSAPQWVTSEAQPYPAGKPKMPRDLPPVAQAEWKRLVRELQRRGTLTRCDSSALEIYAITFARWKQAVAECDKYGPTIETSWTDGSGTVHTKRVENPASKIAGRLENSLRAMLKEFSATPASREKAKPAAPPEPGPNECPWPEGSMGWIEWMKEKGAHAPQPTTEPVTQASIAEHATDFEV